MIQLGAGIHGGMVITPDFRRSGSNAVQVTYFTRDGQPSGHTQFKSLADALDENFLDVDHPVSRLKKNTDPAKVFSAYEEAIFEPHNDEILNTPFHYLSPLRPLSGVAVEGFVSSDLSGRMGVLSRYEPLDLDTQTRLDMFPMSPEAIRAAAEEMAVMLAPKLKSRYARKLAENMSIPQSWPYATSGSNPSTEIHSTMSRNMKGFLLDDLSVVAWETNQFGQPHHADMNFRDIAPGRIDLANLIVDQNGNALIVLDHEAHEKIDEAVRAALSKMTLGSLESRVFIDTEWGTHLTIPARDARKKFGVRIDTASNPLGRTPKPDSVYDPAELARGIEVEFEHTDDPEIAKVIAKDHLDEDPHYYARLLEAGITHNPPESAPDLRTQYDRFKAIDNAIGVSGGGTGVPVILHHRHLFSTDELNRLIPVIENLHPDRIGVTVASVARAAAIPYLVSRDRRSHGVPVTAHNPSYPNPVHALRDILEQIQDGKQPGLYDFGQVLRWLDIALTGRTMKNMHDYARIAELMIDETRG